MAKLLTKNYQKISTIKLTYGEIRTYAKLVDQDIEENLSNYKLKMTYYLSQWIETSSATGTLDGKTKSYGHTRFNAGETTILEVSREIEHNEDGSSPIKNVSSKWTASFGGSGSTDEDIIMPKIDRLAFLDETSLPTSITDESSIKFSYSNPAGFKVKPVITITQDSLISIEGDYITTSPYTWDWLTTVANKELVYDCVRSSPNATARLKLNTYDSNNNLIGSTMSAVTIPFTLVNCSPTINLTCNEQNAKVKSIVGSKLILLNNVSSLKVDASVTTKKNATVVEVLIQDKKVSSPYSTIFTVTGDSGDYKVNASVRDSRQLIVTGASSTYQLIDYRPVTINSYNFKRESPTSSKIYLSANITYWDIELNGTKNIPTLSYSTDGLSYIIIPTNYYTIDKENKLITIENYLVPTTLNYKNQGTYYLKASDLFTEDNENEIVTKGIAIFEKGEHDVQVNGTLYVADENRQNKKAIKPVVDNLDGNETDQSPSVRAVKDGLENASKENYSTEEQIIGTWIDGKPLYRKVINVGTLPNSTSKAVAHGAANIDRIVYFKGSAYQSSGLTITLPFISTVGANMITMTVDKTNITTQAGINRTNFTAIVILEYTKTTD